MNKQQALTIPDLCIDVDDYTEDAFYFLNHVENQKTTDEVLAMSEDQERQYDAYCQSCSNAGERLSRLPYKQRMEAIRKAYRMLDNQDKYGVPCASWCKD
jgi:hypothetical protein